MTVTLEELAAYADGELEGAEAARMLLAVSASPELMRMVQQHRALRERIGQEFAPILRQEVPERLAALLRIPEEGSGEGPKRESEVAARTLGPAARQPQRKAGHMPAHAVSGEGQRGPRHRGWLVVPLLVAAMGLAAFVPSDAGPEAGGATEQEPAALLGSVEQASAPATALKGDAKPSPGTLAAHAGE